MSGDANKEYSVNWKNHMSHILKAFDYLYSSSELVDVTLCCEGRKIGAHKMLLSACSAYFRDIFKDVPCQHPVIILKGVEHSVLSDILHFIYNGEVSVDTAKLDSFLKTAQLLQISGLTDSNERMAAEEETVNEQLPTLVPINQQICDDQPQATTTGSTSLEMKKTIKRVLASKEQEQPPEKVIRHDHHDTLFISDIKSEPSDLTTFDEPLEDPLQNDNIGLRPDDELKQEIGTATDEAVSGLLPTKSQDRYEAEYASWETWMREKNFSAVNETVLLEYFNEKSKVYQCSSLWSKYSMIKRMLLVKKDVDISSYRKVVSFLKHNSVGHEAKKAKVLSKENVIDFIADAPDDTYLMTKVALVFGIYGALTREELANMSVNDIEDRGSVLLVTIPNSHTNKKRVFTIVDDDAVAGLVLYKKYAALRPSNTNISRFFLQYRKSVCTIQPVGKNAFGAIPKTIAKYLQLPNPECYTLTFRKTSATLLSDSRTDITYGKMKGGRGYPQL